MIEKIIRDFMTIWTTVDPITNLALFAGLTAAMHRSERRRIAWRASVYATIILTVAVIIGQILLDAMGIRLRSLQVAGGCILFVFGLQMVFGWIEQSGASVEKGRDLAVFPLAVPAIAGPGAITAIILLTDNDVFSVGERAETAVVLLVVLASNYVLLLLSDSILRVIGQQGAAVLSRVMGIILTALSVEFVLTRLFQASSRVKSRNQSVAGRHLIIRMSSPTTLPGHQRLFGAGLNPACLASCSVMY